MQLYEANIENRDPKENKKPRFDDKQCWTTYFKQLELGSATGGLMQKKLVPLF